MDLLLVALGAAVLGAAAIDVIATTISAGLPGGFLTRRLGLFMWRRAVSLADGRHGVLQVAGLTIVLSIIVVWVSLIIGGWLLVIQGLGGVEHSATGLRGSWTDALYYVGYTVSTMGNGDLVAITDPARLATVLASISGLLTLTMCITYLVPVLSATAHKRQLATVLHALGPTPGELAERLWPDGDLEANAGLTNDLAFRIREMTQQHHSYPVLHFFHARHRRTAVAPGIAALDEALHGVIPHDCEQVDRHRALPTAVHLLHESVGEFLQSLATTFVDTDVPEPPPIVLERGRTTTDDRVPRSERRQRLAAFCADDGWSWDDVTEPEPAPS